MSCGYYTCVCQEHSWRHQRHPSWSWGCGWNIGYHGKNWSVTIFDCWPYTWYNYNSFCLRRPVIETEVIYRPVYYYQPVYVPVWQPAAVDLYDETDRLIDALKYGDVEQRKQAARELVYQDRQRALYPFIYALESDPDATVRYLAAKALGKLNLPDALPALRKAADADPDEIVRSEAQDSIDIILRG